jgi:hypothetical protein
MIIPARRFSHFQHKTDNKLASSVCKLTGSNADWLLMNQSTYQKRGLGRRRIVLFVSRLTLSVSVQRLYILPYQQHLA